MIEKIYKKAIYALARAAVKKYIELRKKKKREQKKIKHNKSANLTNSTKKLHRC